jgi:putative oxidoreductase
MGENRIKFAAREIEAGGTCMLATDSPKRVFPGLAAFHERIAPFGYPLMRIAAGAIIMPHAFPKLFGSFAPVLAKNVLAPLGFLDFPDPLFWAYFLGVLELVGGGLLVLGLLTRVAALGLAIETAVITYFVAMPKGWFYASPGGGAEFPAILTLLYLGILLAGPGRCALDRLVAKRWSIGIL